MKTIGHFLIFVAFFLVAFFFVRRFPRATFTIGSLTAREASTVTEVNFDVVGALEVRGVGKKIRFPATVNPLDDGRVAAARMGTGILLLDPSDPAETPDPLAPGREVRLRWGYFITCTNVIKDGNGEIVELRCTYDPETRGGSAPDGRRVKATMHWVSAEHALPAEVRVYDRLFNIEDPNAIKDLAEARNKAEQMIYTVKKTLEEHGDKASDEEKTEIEAKIEALEEARKSEDTESINSAAEELMRSSHKLAERVYQQAVSDQRMQRGCREGAEDDIGGSDRQAHAEYQRGQGDQGDGDQPAHEDRVEQEGPDELQHEILPLLENGGRRVPEHRELEQDDVVVEQTLLLLVDIDVVPRVFSVQIYKRNAAERTGHVSHACVDVRVLVARVGVVDDQAGQGAYS